MKKILEVNNIERIYGRKDVVTKALDNITFSVYEKEFVGIMGASGSGKTTLLNCISTIDSPTSGSIILNDKNLNDLKGNELAKFRKDNLGFIFQDFNLLNSLTAFENISLSLTLSNCKKDEIFKKVNELAKKFNIDNCLDKYPYQMSGGEKQRCAALRAIISNPSLVLADEPTGALDSKSSRILLDSLVEMNNTMDATILMVTHDAYAASYCKRILFIKDGVIFNEIYRGESTRKEFFDKIVDVISLLGGNLNDN